AQGYRRTESCTWGRYRQSHIERCKCPAACRRRIREGNGTRLEMREICERKRDQRCHVWLCDGSCCADGRGVQCPRQYPIAWRGILLRRQDAEGTDGIGKQSR